jgi:glycosyltransferase involved in cell wall biosynthesis
MSNGMTPATQSMKILIPFNSSGLLYGMERGVIELFDFLRPQVMPHFVISQTVRRENLPVFEEIERRRFSYSFFSDSSPWPAPAKPRSLTGARNLLVALWKGNSDILRQAQHCDAIYLSGLRYGFFAIWACFYCRLTGKRIIFQFHDLVAYRSRALWCLQFAVRSFIHMTQTGFRMVSEANPFLLKKNNHIIPYVVHTPETSPSDDLPETLSHGKRTILFVGQVSLHKGVDLLLQAMALLGDDYPDVVLLVLGGCQPEFRPVFDAILADPKLASRVVYLGYRTDAIQFMKRAYLQILPTPPSRYQEGAPRTMLEAMACGLPLISMQSGGSVDLVVHGETGLLCEREDAGCIAEKLRQLLDDREFRDRCAANTSLRFQTIFSPKNVAAEWQKLLENDC